MVSYQGTVTLHQRFTKKQGVLFVSLEVKDKFTQHNISMLGVFLLLSEHQTCAQCRFNLLLVVECKWKGVL